MRARPQGPALDRFRLAAAALVVCIHTGPLETYSPAADFWLCRCLARTAVPFFLMVSGYFLARDGWKTTGRFLKKTARTYLTAVLLCLPLNLYRGGYGPLEWGRRLLLEGTLYHLWYFPALLLGAPLARGLTRLGRPAALAAASGLYLLGLGGDSYYAPASRLPGLGAFYDGVFAVFGYTRNGLFYVPLFLLLGAEGRQWSPRVSAWGTALGLALLSAEGFALRALGWPRHDSMYLTLPLCMACLFSLLLNQNRGEDRRARRISLLVYLLHPWCIVLVRGGAKVVGMQRWFIDNSGGHFLAVLAVSLCAAWCVCAVGERIRR